MTQPLWHDNPDLARRAAWPLPYPGGPPGNPWCSSQQTSTASDFQDTLPLCLVLMPLYSCCKPSLFRVGEFRDQAAAALADLQAEVQAGVAAAGVAAGHGQACERMWHGNRCNSTFNASWSCGELTALVDSCWLQTSSLSKTSSSELSFAVLLQQQGGANAAPRCRSDQQQPAQQQSSAPSCTVDASDLQVPKIARQPPRSNLVMVPSSSAAGAAAAATSAAADIMVLPATTLQLASWNGGCCCWLLQQLCCPLWSSDGGQTGPAGACGPPPEQCWSGPAASRFRGGCHFRHLRSRQGRREDHHAGRCKVRRSDLSRVMSVDAALSSPHHQLSYSYSNSYSHGCL